jgi:hypothetical protein
MVRDVATIRAAAAALFAALLTMPPARSAFADSPSLFGPSEVADTASTADYCRRPPMSAQVAQQVSAGGLPAGLLALGRAQFDSSERILASHVVNATSLAAPIYAQALVVLCGAQSLMAKSYVSDLKGLKTSDNYIGRSLLRLGVNADAAQAFRAALSLALAEPAPSPADLESISLNLQQAYSNQGNLECSILFGKLAAQVKSDPGAAPAATRRTLAGAGRC